MQGEITLRVMLGVINQHQVRPGVTHTAGGGKQPGVVVFAIDIGIHRDKRRRPQHRQRGGDAASGFQRDLLARIINRHPVARTITERRLKDEPTTLEDLSVEYNVSRERIRQIEVRAFEKLQKAMREQARERGLVEAN